MKKNNDKIALFVCVASFLTWGSLAIYWSQLKAVNAVEIVAHRAVWSLIVAGIFTVVLREALQVAKVFKTPRLMFALAASSCMIALNWGIYIWAVTNGRIVETSMGYYINPLLNVAASALIFKTSMNKFQIAAIVLAVIGVANMIVGYGAVPWIALTLAVSFCLYGVIRKITPVDAMAGLFVETLVIAGPAAVYLAYLTASGRGAVASGEWHAVALLLLGGLVTTLPLAGFAYGAKNLNLSTVGVIQYISPTTSFMIGVFLYGETFTASHLISFIFIWAGLAVYTVDSLVRFKVSNKKNKLINYEMEKQDE